MLGFCLFWEGSIFFFPSKLKMPFLLGYNNLSTKAPGVVSFHYQASTAGPCTWRYEIHPTFIFQCAQWSTSPYNIFWSLSLMRKPPNFYHCMCPRTLIIFSPAIIFQSVLLWDSMWGSLLLLPLLFLFAIKHLLLNSLTLVTAFIFGFRPFFHMSISLALSKKWIQCPRQFSQPQREWALLGGHPFGFIGKSWNLRGGMKSNFKISVFFPGMQFLFPSQP